MKVLCLISLMLFSVLSYGQSENRYDETQITAQAKFIEGKGFMFSGKYEKAIEAFKLVLVENRAWHAVSYELARAYSLTGDNDSAEKHLKDALNNDGSNIGYLTFAADYYARQDRIKEAEAMLSQLIDLAPHQTVYYDQLAGIYASEGKSDQAVSVYSRLEAQRGVSETTIKKKYDIYKESRDVKGAEKALLALEELDPTSTSFLTSIAQFYKQTEQPEKAKNYFEKVLQLNPDDSKASYEIAQLSSSGSSLQSDALIDMISDADINIDSKIKALIPRVEALTASSSQTEKDNLSAASDRLVEKHPDDAKSYAIAGDMAFNVENYTKARTLYQKTLDKDDSVFAVWMQLMECQSIEKKYAELVETSTSAIDYFPNKAIAFIYNAEGLSGSGKIAEAQDIIEEAKFVSGNNMKLILLTEITQGKVQFLANDTAAGTSILDRLGEVDFSKHPELLEKLGDLYYVSGDSSKAVSTWKKAVASGYGSGVLAKKIEAKGL